MSDAEVEEPAAEPQPIAEQPAPNAGIQPAVPLQGIQPPTGLNLSSRNKGEIWKLYKQQWMNYEIVAQLNRQTEEYRIALLLYSIGPQAVKIYNGFDLKKTSVISIRSSRPLTDTPLERQTKHSSATYSPKQQEGESMDKYIAELRILAQSFNFCNCLHDSLIRDRIVLGIKDSGARKRLLQQQQLTLQRCVDICKASEASNTQIKSLAQSVKEEIRRVKEKSKRVKKTGRGRVRIKTERPEIARQEGGSTTYLQVLWRQSPIWPATLSSLGGKL